MQKKLSLAAHALAHFGGRGGRKTAIPLDFIFGKQDDGGRAQLKTAHFIPFIQDDVLIRVK